MDETPAVALSRSARRRLTAGVSIALAGTALGAGALLMAVLDVVAGDDRALWWMFAAMLAPTWGYTIAWSRLMSVWSRASEKVRYFVLRSSRPFTVVGRLSSFWLPLSQTIALGALVWLVTRLVDGASGWFGAAIPAVIVAGLIALSGCFTVAWDASELGLSIATFAFVTGIADAEIERELAKHRPSGGFSDWNSFWLWRIEYFTEKPVVDRPTGDYVDYIVASRAAAGLPPLDGIEAATARADAAGPRDGPRSIVSGRFLVDGHDLGLAAESVLTFRDGLLDADFTAAVIPARAEGWALAPPRVYFHGLDVSDGTADGRIDIDEAYLEDYDIACYMEAHFDVLGTLTLDATRLRFSGETVLASDDRWPIEIDVAFEPA